MDIFKDRIWPMFESSGQKDKFLEEAIGLPRGIIYKWKSGKNKNCKFYVTDIASYFHVSTDYLLGSTDDPSPAGQKENPQPPAEGIDPVTQELYDIIGKISRGKLMMLLEKAQEIEKF